MSKGLGVAGLVPCYLSALQAEFSGPHENLGLSPLLPRRAELEVDGLPSPNCFAALTYASSELGLGVTPLIPILA